MLRFHQPPDQQVSPCNMQAVVSLNLRKFKLDKQIKAHKELYDEGCLLAWQHSVLAKVQATLDDVINLLSVLNGQKSADTNTFLAMCYLDEKESGYPISKALIELGYLEFVLKYGNWDEETKNMFMGNSVKLSEVNSPPGGPSLS